jgi:NADH:ubiquinone oxidoreductase subunit F (NADH-binding)
VHVLGEGSSPLTESARVIRHLADESAAQCGPCFFGLRSLAAATERLATGHAEERDLEQLHRWAGMVKGRGACRHPDGAAVFMESALRLFAPEFAAAAGAA